MRMKLLCLSLIAATPAAAVNWPQPGLNAAHTGFNPAETTIGTANIGRLTQKWAAPAPNGISAPPIELRGVAYFETQQGTVYAINAATGKTVWTYAAGGIQGVVAGGNLLYVACHVDANHVGMCALNAATGKLVWSQAVTASTSSSPDNVPVLDHGLLFYEYNYGGFNSPVSGNDFYARNAATGALVWAISGYNVPYGADRTDQLPFAVAGGKLFYQAGGPSAYTYICAVKEADGSGTQCSPALSGNSNAAISVSGGKVLVQYNDSNLSHTVFTALDGNTLAVLWQFPVAGFSSNYSFYPPAIAKGLAYFYAGQNGQGSLYALSLNKGTERWSYACGGAAGCLDSGVAVANGVLYASCARQTPFKGDQCAFDAATGAVLRLYGSTDGQSGSEATPLVANGAEIAVCGANAGNLCKFAP